MSIAEAAVALGCSRRHVFNLIQRGELIAWRNPAYRKGGPVRISRDQIDAIKRRGESADLPTPHQ